MKSKLLFVLVLFAVSLFSAEGIGIIGWEDVRGRIAKSDPNLVQIIQRNFIVDRMGVALRLGPDFGKHAGESVPPYDFDAVRKSTGDRYNLQISESDDYQFTGRFRFIWRLLEEKKK